MLEQSAAAEIRGERQTTPLIRVKDLSKSFGRRVLWKNLSVDVSRGQVVALTGPSGAGKSTLLNCVGLLESVDSGQIVVDGQDITRFRAGAARRFRRDMLGYLFQNYALIENATIRDNLDVAVPNRHRRRRRAEYQRVLESVGMGDRAGETVYRLSGGEQQRVALARLLVKRPPIVLADEPTGALDEDNGDMVIATLRGMAENGCAVIIATHSGQVIEACDTVVRV